MIRVSHIREKRKFHFVAKNSNTPNDQAQSSTSCYRVTTLYIRAVDTRNLFMVFTCHVVSDIGERQMIYVRL